MKKIIIIFICILEISCSSNNNSGSSTQSPTVPPLNKSLASKPPMGWNSWDCLGWDANEKEVRAAADYMKVNLKQLGYEYIVIDQLWYGDSSASNFEDFVHERIPVKPTYH